MKRRSAVCFVLLGVLLAGCHPAGNESGLLVYAGDWQMPPAYSGNPWNPQGVGAAAGFVFEPLFVYVPQTASFRPRLGTHYVESPDGLTLRVELQPHALWHDGQPFTSADVQATFDLAALFHDRTWRYLQSVACPDATTVVFHWKQYEISNTMRALTMPITSARHGFEPWVDEAAEWLRRGAPESGATALRSDLLRYHPELPVGTGPFRVVSVTASDMTLDRFDRHYQADHVRIRAIRLVRWPSNQVVWGYLRGGDMDMGTPGCPQDVVDELLAHNPHLHVGLVPDRNEFGIGFNCGRRPLADVRLREALTQLLDRDQIRQICCSAGLTDDDYCTGVVRSRRDDWLSQAFLSTLRPYPHDPAAAAAELQACGLVQRDGLWSTAEGPLHLEVLAPNAMSDVVLLADVVTSQWRRAGVEAEVRVVPIDVYNDMIAAGQFDVEAGYGARLGKFDDPGTSLEYLYALDSPFRQGCGLPTVRQGVDTVALWRSLGTERDGAVRRQTLERLCRMANQELTFVPCYEKRISLFVQDGVRVTGWELQDPTWSAIPGGAETAMATVLLEGRVRSVVKEGERGGS